MDWKQIWTNFKKNWVASSICSIVAGLLLVLFPGQALLNLCYLIGGVAVAMGVVRIVKYFQGDHTYPFLFQPDLIFGLFTLGMGIYVITNARGVISLIPAICGVLLIGCGVGNILRSVDAKRSGVRSWGVLLALAILTVVLGWLIVTNPFPTLEVAVIVIGAGLIYEGVTDLAIVKLVGHRIQTWRNSEGKNA